MPDPRAEENGFSLIELMIAMVVTLIISGAIYGLIAGGDTAFKREPELADRQQNIRAAMDLIMRDIANAGSGMPTFVQTFTPGLNGPAGAPVGLNNTVTDELEILTNDTSRDNEPVCNANGGANSTQVQLKRETPSLDNGGIPVMLIFEDGCWTMRNIVSTNHNNGGPGSCLAGNPHTALNFNQGNNDASGMNTPGGVCKPNAFGMGNANTGNPPGSGQGNGCGGAGLPPACCSCNVVEVSFASLIRYKVRNVNGIPMLQRSSTSDLTGGIQNIARIEDMQVQYRTAANLPAGALVNGAPAVTPGNYGTMIAEVVVTLSARSEARVQGMTTNPSARTAARGSLVSTGSPRSTLFALTRQGGVGVLWK